MHQIACLLYVRTDQLMVALENISASKDKFNVCRIGSEDQRGDLVAYSVKVW